MTKLLPRATKPKSAGSSSFVKIRVLTKPSSRVARRQPTIHPVPAAVRFRISPASIGAAAARTGAVGRA